MPSLFPRGPCCPSLSSRPPDPRPGGRSPLLPLLSSDATVRRSLRPYLFHLPVEHLPAPLLQVPFEVLLPGKSRLLCLLRIGGFRVEQGYTLHPPRGRGLRVKQSHARGGVHDVDHVQFRVGFLGQVHSGPRGQPGLTRPVRGQQDLGRENAHPILFTLRRTSVSQRGSPPAPPPGCSGPSLWTSPRRRRPTRARPPKRRSAPRGIPGGPTGRAPGTLCAVPPPGLRRRARSRVWPRRGSPRRWRGWSRGRAGSARTRPTPRGQKARCPP